MWPHRWQPTRLPRPWDSPGKNTGVGCHFLLQCMKVKSESEVAQSWPTLSNPTDCSLPGSSIHGIFQARELEWVAIIFSSCIYYFCPIFFKFLFLSQMKNTLHLLKNFFNLKSLIFYFYLFFCSTTIQYLVVYSGSPVVSLVIAAILRILALGLWPHSLLDSHHHMRHVGCVISRPEADSGLCTSRWSQLEWRRWAKQGVQNHCW